MYLPFEVIVCSSTDQISKTFKYLKLSLTQCPNKEKKRKAVGITNHFFFFK